MRRLLACALAGIAVAGLATAAEIAPQDVVFGEYGEIEASLSGVPGNAEEGQKVYSSRAAGNCVACHTVSGLVDSVQFHGDVGPPLDGVGSRWSEAELRGIVANAKNVYDGTIMPAFYKVEGFIRPGEGFTTKPAAEPLAPLLTAQQIEDVVAFLMTLQD